MHHAPCMFFEPELSFTFKFGGDLTLVAYSKVKKKEIKKKVAALNF